MHISVRLLHNVCFALPAHSKQHTDQAQADDVHEHHLLPVNPAPECQSC